MNARRSEEHFVTGGCQFLQSHDFHATTSRAADIVAYEGGFAASTSEWNTRANSDGPGISVVGHFMTGGAPTTPSAIRRLQWTTR